MHTTSDVKSDEAMARIAEATTDAEAEAIVATMVARDATIGTEAVAWLHEAEGRPDLARIARLTVDQARTVLCYLNGANPDAMDRAFDFMSRGEDGS